jgi:hypothetical protein
VRRERVTRKRLKKGALDPMGSALTIPATFAAEARDWLRRMSSESEWSSKRVMNGAGTTGSFISLCTQDIHSPPTA